MSARDLCIGREEERAELARLLEKPGAFVTIMGPPGVGKTTLARALFDKKRDVWCSVTDVTTSDGFIAALARTLDIPWDARFARTPERLIPQAPRLPRLLVLDGIEHLVDVAQPLLERWCEIAPRLSVLVTSRRRVGVASEVLFELEPLALEDGAGRRDTSPAVRLFLERAARVRRGFGKSTEEREDMVALVERLEGFPLAIELAAARMSVTSAHDLLERIDAASASTHGNDPTTSALDASITRSWSSLTPHEQSALGQCSVFRGGFTLDAAEHVVRLSGNAPPVVYVVEALRHRSFLRAAPTFRALRLDIHRAIRDFAARHADPKLTRDALERHAAFFAQRSQPLDREDIDNALFALTHTEAHADISTAVHLARALGPTVAAYGPVSPLLHALDAVIGRASPDTDRAMLLLAYQSRAAAHGALGRLEESLADEEDVVRLATALGDEDAMARGLMSQANIHVFLGDERRARDGIDGALRIVERRRNADLSVAALLLSGLIDVVTGDLASARTRLVRSAELARRRKEAEGERRALAYLGLVAHERGDLAEAERLYRRALKSADECSRIAAYVTGYRAMLHHERMDIDAASAAYEKAYETLAKLGDQRAEAWLLASMAALDASRGNVEQAMTRLAEAEHIAIATGDFNALGLARFFKLAPLAARALRGDEAARAEAMRLRDEATQGDRPAVQRSWDVRFVLRIFARMMRAEAPAPGLVVARDGTWFSQSDGTKVSVRKYRAASLLLERLAATHERAPGKPTRLEDLFEAGWPGQRVQTLAATNRIHVTLNRLRQLGLRDVLARTDDGYSLDVSVAINRD